MASARPGIPAGVRELAADGRSSGAATPEGGGAGALAV